VTWRLHFSHSPAYKNPLSVKNSFSFAAGLFRLALGTMFDTFAMDLLNDGLQAIIDFFANGLVKFGFTGIASDEVSHETQREHDWLS